MAFKKPEVRSLAHHMAAAPHMTVSQFRRDHWVLMTRCPVCHLDCWVDLDAVVRLAGPETRLWNARSRCRRYGCDGRMIFLCTPPGQSRGAFWALGDDRGAKRGIP